MQTIDDLRLFSKADTQGIYDIYNHSFTRGGQNIMEAMFRKPLNNREAIIKRINTIAAFVKMNATFPFKVAVAGRIDARRDNLCVRVESDCPMCSSNSPQRSETACSLRMSIRVTGMPV